MGALDTDVTINFLIVPRDPDSQTVKQSELYAHRKTNKTLK